MRQQNCRVRSATPEFSCNAREIISTAASYSELFVFAKCDSFIRFRQTVVSCEFANIVPKDSNSRPQLMSKSIYFYLNPERH